MHRRAKDARRRAPGLAVWAPATGHTRRRGGGVPTCRTHRTDAPEHTQSALLLELPRVAPVPWGGYGPDAASDTQPPATHDSNLELIGH